MRPGLSPGFSFMENYLKVSHKLVFFSSALILILLFAPTIEAQHFSNPGLLSTQDDHDAFVVYQDRLGQTTCREANDVERASISRSRTGQTTTLIYAGAPLRSKQSKSNVFVDSVSGLTLQPSAGLRIVLHGTAQLDQNPQAKNAFIIAANRWEAIISNPITVVLDVDYGPTFFGEAYDDPDILGLTSSAIFISTYGEVRSRLVDTASNGFEQQLYAALPLSGVPVDFNGTTSNVTSVRLTLPNARALALSSNIANPDAIPAGAGDAEIGFNSNFSFDFNPADGISSNQTDFDSVATHEIGHALGFSSRSGGSTSTPVATLDLFRVGGSNANLSAFTTTPRIMSKGGDQVLFGNRLSTFGTLGLGLSTGGPNPSPSDGDGRQSSHWKDDNLFSTDPYIGVMDPTLRAGLRRTITENDINALDLVGYSIGLPAPSRPANNDMASAINLTTASGTLAGNNTNATREAGEPNHAGFMGDKSVWYKWTSTVTGTMTVDTIGSNFDTTLGVYTGTSVSQLTTIAQNDDISDIDKDSRVQFGVTTGITYLIAADGWNGEYGNITLNWTANSGPPPTPTPTPTPVNSFDIAMELFSTPINPAMRTQTIPLNFTARNLGPATAFRSTVKVLLPSGMTLVTCSPLCISPPQGTIEADFSFPVIDPGVAVTGVVFARVTAPAGSMLTATASIVTDLTDANSNNNSISKIINVTEVLPFSEAKAISVQEATALALRRGTVWAWGSNSFGQLGDGTRIEKTIPVQVENLTSVKAIASGVFTSYALKDDGTVWAWGDNTDGKLGIGVMSIADSTIPMKVSGLDSVIAIAAGRTHALALKSDGTVWSWGRNNSGVLGLGSTSMFDIRSEPTKIPGLSGIVSISSRDNTAFAIRDDGSVFGWGQNMSGELGIGTTSDAVPTPVESVGMKGARTISYGDGCTIIIKQDNSVWSCGSNTRGRLGIGSADEGIHPLPSQIPSLTATLSSSSTHAIVLISDGTIRSFGGNGSGQLGFNTSDSNSHPTPITVNGISGAFGLETPNNSSFVLIGDPVGGGVIKAWGANFGGILGNGTNPNANQISPIMVAENLSVAKPIFSLPDGVIPSNTAIKISCGTPGSVVHYTTEFREPTESDPIASGPITFNSSVRVTAKAWRAGFITSPTVLANYLVPTTPNPIDDPRLFVRQQYLDFLGRQPDINGWDFWTDQINKCGTDQSCIDLMRINVSAAFFLSIEFQQTGYLVERVHKAAYGDATGLSTLGGSHSLKVPIIKRTDMQVDQQSIAQGVIVGEGLWQSKLEENTQKFYNDFVLRASFASAFPTLMSGAEFVDKLNQNAGSPLSQTERNTLVASYQSTNASRVQILRTIVDHPNFVNAEKNRAFVLMQYFGYLQRNPSDTPDSDYTGYDFWLNKLNQFNGNFVNAEMVKAFIISGEYRNRFKQ